MSEDSFDQEWELSSGLPLDGMTATISAAEFGYRQNIAKDALFACLEFSPDEGESQEQAFSIGKGWAVKGKGAEIEDANGKRRNINDSTGYGKFIAAAIALPGVKEALRARNGNPKLAATWVGLRFVLGIVKEQTTNPTTKQVKESSRVVPVEFLGAVSSDGKVTAASGGKAAASTIPAELDAKLLALAGTHSTHDDFMAAAFELDEVTGDSAVETAVLDTSKNGIWQRATAAA